jgi:predicted 2-oxoglutarate/Fe(II)-dependent dioxygenase YbiX
MSIEVGDPLPWLTGRSSLVPEFRFESVGGMRLVLVAWGSLRDPRLVPFVEALPGLAEAVQARGAYMAAISSDPADRGHETVRQLDPLIPVVEDHDGALVRQLGLVFEEGGARRMVPTVIVTDEALCVLAIVRPLQPGVTAQTVLQALDRTPASEAARPGLHPPVLTIPRVLGPDLCRRLMRQWEDGGNVDSGYVMPGSGGRLTEYLDPARKVRRDHVVAADSALYRELRMLVGRRVVPMIRRAFHFEVSRVERFCIACYDAGDRGHFLRHRDFDGPASHRNFAMTLNLNAGEYEGGELRFPEYGNAAYAPASGDAVVFSGYLMHEAAPVTAGRRFALLSFLYGEREQAVLDRYTAAFGRDVTKVKVG